MTRLHNQIEPSAQEFTLKNLCNLCIVNIRNQLRACKNHLLFSLIELFNYHEKFSRNSIQKLFRTIQILGRCSINNKEVRLLVEFLHPTKQFPYGMEVLRCFVYWAKYTTAVGLNLSSLTYQNDANTPSNNNSLIGGGENNAAGFNQNLITNSQNDTSLLIAAGGGGSLTSTGADLKLKRSSIISINQTALNNIMSRTAGTGGLSVNAQQQAKYFSIFNTSTRAFEYRP